MISNNSRIVGYFDVYDQIEIREQIKSNSKFPRRVWGLLPTIQEDIVE